MDAVEKFLVGLIVFVIAIVVFGMYMSSHHDSELNRWLSACRGEGGIASLVETNRVECFDKNNKIIYLKICEQINCN